MGPADSTTAAAERVREAIRDDVYDGLSALVDFASRNAVTPGLRHETLLLKFNQRNAGSAVDTQTLERRMFELVDRITDDHLQHFDGAQAEARQHRVSQLHADYLAQARVVAPVFVSERLGKRYGSFRLRGVDLTLRAGEVTAIVGQNANGKTTLLRMVAGELRADEGHLSYPSLQQGRGLNWAEIKSQIAYLSQDLPSWHGALLDNLRYEAALHGLRGQDNDREVDFFVERLGLREHVGKRWSQLSGGYKLRFALARVLIWKPRLLVLDEPLANLDVVAQSRLLQDIVDLARSPRYPIAVLMSSQHLHELEAVANNIVFLRAGEVQFNGPMHEIGSDRSYNVYELGTTTELAQWRHLFDDPRHEPPAFDGVSYVIKTATTVSAATVLAKLLETGADVRYFRDISRSIKSFFE